MYKSLPSFASAPSPPPALGASVSPSHSSSVKCCEESTLTVLGRVARLDQGDNGGPLELINPRRRALAGVPPTLFGGAGEGVRRE